MQSKLHDFKVHWYTGRVEPEQITMMCHWSGSYHHHLFGVMLEGQPPTSDLAKSIVVIVAQLRCENGNDNGETDNYDKRNADA